MLDIDDTIVAIASPTSPALRGVVRLSGPNVVDVLTRLKIDVASAVAHRLGFEVNLGDSLGSVHVDAMVWPTPRSYTGQPSAELHTHGSLPILGRLVRMATEAGARAARPGEFTMRAFLAGRLDLTQAEAVLGVIDAEGRGSLDHALRQLAGNLSRPLETMRSTLLDLLADVEAGLDFVDEDIEFVSDETLIARLTEMRDVLAVTIESLNQRGGGSARRTIALRGKPNAGKSRLLNRLSNSNAAIVADVAGTTRDIVTTECSLGGHPVLLVDTAGIEISTDDVSEQSQSQAIRAAREADLRLWCVDGSGHDAVAELNHLRSVATADADRKTSVIDLFVMTKSDLGDKALPDSGAITCSAVTAQGIDDLVGAIVGAIEQRDAEETGSVVGTAARCQQSLDQAMTAITTAIAMTGSGDGHEFVSAELRLAIECLGEVTGAVYTDDILDRVFGRFCIGK